MVDEARGKRLTVFVGEYDRYHHHSLADAIVERAREEGLAGVTLMRGIEGFGSGGRLKTSRLLSASDDLPLVIEIIDEAHRIDRFVTVLERMVKDHLVISVNIDLRVVRTPEAHPLDDD
jgi:PII-like signaling protein